MREGYVRKSISEICDKASSNIAQNKIADINGDYPVYGASGYVQNVDFYHRDTDYIGIVKDGSGVGRVNVYPAYSSLLGTMQYIIPKDGYLLGYVAYALKGLNLSSFASGAAIPHIYFKDYGKCKIDVPPLSEQQRIVSELDLLSSIIEKKKVQLKEYNQFAQSIFYDMFGDPVENPKGWEVKRLENVVSDNCSISYGIVQPGDDVENGVPIVRPIDLVNRIVKRKGLKVVEKSISDSYKRTILDGNELLLCVRGTTGVMSFASSELKGCNVTRGITPLSFNEGVEKQYVYYLFKTSFIQSIIAEKTRGIALKQINMKDVRELPILIPPLSLQQSFASKIEAIERQKALIQQSIIETETLFNSRMDYYFN